VRRPPLLLPRRPARTPSRRERFVGFSLLAVLLVAVGLFAATRGLPGPPALPETEAAPLSSGTLAPRSPAGWPRGAVETYGADALFEKINGKADSYLAYRFGSLSFASYANPAEADAWVDVYVYEMAEPLDAFGVHRAQRSGAEEVVPVGDEGVRAGDAVFFRRGRHYVEVLASGAPARAEALALAEALGRSLPAGPGAVATPAGLPVEGLVALRFQRSGALGVDALTDAFVATYGDGTRILIATLAAADLAAAAAREAEENLRFLGQAATFVASGPRVVGVVGPADESRRKSLVEAALAAGPEGPR
jgi:hypothetical protein